MALGVTTWILPVLAPDGTFASMKVGETTRKAVATPLKLTLEVPVRFVPRIPIVAPTFSLQGIEF